MFPGADVTEENKVSKVNRTQKPESKGETPKDVTGERMAPKPSVRDPNQATFSGWSHPDIFFETSRHLKAFF